MKKTFRGIGLVLICIGVFIIVIQPLSMTGAVIGIESLSGLNVLIGFILLIGGIIFFGVGLEGKVVPAIEDIEKTRQFEKATKGVDKKMLQRAINKIGRGLGNQKPGRYKEINNSIRVDKGGRIFYQQIGGRIILTQYTPSSKHH
jgi:hypothetical protein